LHPRLPAAHYNLGNDLLAQGRYHQAVREFSRAGLDPAFEPARRNLEQVPAAL
jgi:Tfp pilus assembly protein PilF